MKIVVVAFLLLVMAAACKDEKKEKKPENRVPVPDSLATVSDTNYFEIDTPYLLQKDIALDTIDLVRKDSCSSVYIVLPRKTSANSILYKKIDLIRERAIRDYKEVKKEDKVPCDDYHWESFWLEPMHLYQSNKFISYVIRLGRAFPGTPSGFENYSINLDRETKKEIQLTDFFHLETYRDSLRLAEIISNSIGEGDRLKENENRLIFYFESSYGFDDRNVYFFFESHGIAGYRGSIGVIRKKFISSLIQERFR